MDPFDFPLIAKTQYAKNANAFCAEFEITALDYAALERFWPHEDELEPYPY